MDRNIKILYKGDEYIYYEGVDAYVHNILDYDDDYFIPPTLRTIISELPESLICDVLVSILSIYDEGKNRGKRELQKEIRNTFKLLFDLDED